MDSMLRVKCDIFESDVADVRLAKRTVLERS